MSCVRWCLWVSESLCALFVSSISSCFWFTSGTFNYLLFERQNWGPVILFILTAVDCCTQAAPYVFIYEATYIDVSKIPTHRNLSNTSHCVITLYDSCYTLEKRTKKRIGCFHSSREDEWSWTMKNTPINLECHFIDRPDRTDRPTKPTANP